LVLGEGIVGIWYSWSAAISALLATFLFARLWQRSKVLTDAELIELRYSGRPAAFLRFFKGLYFGLLFNAFIMGWVFLALIKVIQGLGDLPLTPVLVGTTFLVFVYSVASGFYGVVLTDFIQYFVALVGSVLLATLAVRKVGGLHALRDGIVATSPETLHFLPELSTGVGPLSVFFTYLLVQWWANKYADGGGKHIQRMLSARSEDDAFAASLLYSFLNFALQIWPWILTALVGMLLFGDTADAAQTYSRVMVEVLPPGLLGLALAGLVGAFMSTIDTHLNLGASYLINDIYKRFIRRNTTPRHDVIASRLAMAGLLAISVYLALHMTSVSGAWKFLLTFASGAGPVWIVRWFWWRVNAWSELSAMVTSGIVASALALLRPDWIYSAKLLTTVGISTVVWLIVTFLTPPASKEQLEIFVARVQPGRFGWRELTGTPNESHAYLGPALLRWMLALVTFFSLNFGVGALLLKSVAAGLFGIFLAILGLITLWRVIPRRSQAS
jgi:SSS family solute:Na+ symporter